jgi:hypothetical protein
MALGAEANLDFEFIELIVRVVWVGAVLDQLVVVALGTRYDRVLIRFVVAVETQAVYVPPLCNFLVVLPWTIDSTC